MRKSVLYFSCVLLLMQNLGPLSVAAYAAEEEVSKNAPVKEDIEQDKIQHIDGAAAFLHHLSQKQKSEIQRFCGNVNKKVEAAYFARQRKELEAIRLGIEQRIKLLEEKKKAYELWVKKRENFIKRARDSLVAIMAKMKPDAAAAQLNLVDDLTAAAVLFKLKPRVASAILDEMPAKKSAGLLTILASAQDPQTEETSAKTPTQKP